MNNIMQFGKHEGETFEWIFFHQPHYARYIRRMGMPHQDSFGEEEGEYFMELYKRASRITGTCPRCKERPITYLGLIYHNSTDRLGGVGYYCDECEYHGGAQVGYYTPSFFVKAFELSWPDQRRIPKEVKRLFIGSGNLTQAKMEAFFHDDANFVNATPGFFTQVREEAAP